MTHLMEIKSRASFTLNQINSSKLMKIFQKTIPQWTTKILLQRISMKKKNNISLNAFVTTGSSTLIMIKMKTRRNPMKWKRMNKARAKISIDSKKLDSNPSSQSSNYKLLATKMPDWQRESLTNSGNSIIKACARITSKKIRVGTLQT